MRKTVEWIKGKRIIIGSVALIAVISGGGTYLATKNYYQNLLADAHPIFVAHSPYALLHPILGISVPGDQFNDGFPDVRSGIQSIVSAEPQGTLTRYSVYLRELDSGHWTGINEHEPFDPASLLKVVVAIAAYKQAEIRPSFLVTPLVYTKDLAQVNAQLPFAQPAELAVGQSYTVPYLVKKELSDSDNSAVYTLLSAIDPQTLDSVYDDLSIPRPNATDSEGYKLTAFEYSRFFRILYLGTLDLAWADSEQILENLSQSTFTTGLVAGVPSTVTVAHKFGEHVTGPSDVELSDCGIVYAPGKPYFLCVMTEGNDQASLANVIAQISRFVYQKMNAQASS
ncbi:MAG TPA: serine hydrolase [Chloroflexota bacterium]